MTHNEIRNQELARHEEKVDRNVERHQAVNLNEKERSIAVSKQNSGVARFVNISYYLFGALELLLMIRFFLYLIGANMNNGFANFIDALSYPFVVVFATLLNNPTFGTVADTTQTASVLEITTLIAMLAYAVLAWLVGRLIWLMLSHPRR